MILNIKAKFGCDRCGREFTVQLDPADQPKPGWSIFEVAENWLRSGHGYEDTDTEFQDGYCGSADDDKHLCRRCTVKQDAKEAKE